MLTTLPDIPRYCKCCDRLMLTPRSNQDFCHVNCRVHHWKRTRRLNAFVVRELLIESERMTNQVNRLQNEQLWQENLAKAYLHLGSGLNNLLKEIK